MIQSLLTPEDTVWLLSTLALLVPPSIYIFIRNTIKIHRQGVVKDLSVVFNLPGSGNLHGDDGLVPSFEFVKYKYLLGRPGEEKEKKQEDFSWWAWASGLIALAFALSSVGYIISRFADLSLNTILYGIPDCTNLCANAFGSAECCTVRKSCQGCHYDSRLGMWMCGLLAASAGSYTYMMRNFFRAVNNFDFGPASYISAAKDFIISIITVSILYVGLDFSFSLLGQRAEVHRLSSASLIITAFAFGLLPGSATRTLTNRSKIISFKRENPSLYKNVSVTPVEIVDGIDSEIRDRLADHHILSTQNLATANPLMLFVETPYGVYQIMDWVAQAQLCCSVGPDKMVQFWQLGIRTLFDLERAALNQTYKSQELLLAIGAILFAGSNKSSSNKVSVTPITEALVIASIQVKLDDPHVHRLRQIYIKVGERLGDANRRFGIPPKTEANDIADAYFRWLKRWNR